MIKYRKVYYEYQGSIPHSPHPNIKIAGKYLELWGFQIGDTIKVVFAQGKIIIEKINSALGSDKQKASVEKTG
jgi:hypothetical protein